MTKTHILGCARMGAQRQLKFALEAYWNGEKTQEELLKAAQDIRAQNWQDQKKLDYITIGDFSLYDHVLDMSFTLGHIPPRVHTDLNELDAYFHVARGRAQKTDNQTCIHAGEMTKWFNTNYHYIVPELYNTTTFKCNPSRLCEQIAQARAQGIPASQMKVVIIGPLTYLHLSKVKNSGLAPLSFLIPLLEVYSQLLSTLAKEGVAWVQIDEPILSLDMDKNWQESFVLTHQALLSDLAKLPSRPKIMLANYFGALQNNLDLLDGLKFDGLHVDALSGAEDLPSIIQKFTQLHKQSVLSLGVVDGRNIWKNDLTATLQNIQPAAKALGERLYISSSCSLLHVPADLAQEEKMPADIRTWLAFGRQKIDEITVLQQGIQSGGASIQQELDACNAAMRARKTSAKVQRPDVQAAVAQLHQEAHERQSPYPKRAAAQQAFFNLPLLPTTTIGSFPQTPAIRQARAQFKRQELSAEQYDAAMQKEIQYCVQQQEALNIDVLVHGEAERNDMVEYFGEQLDGYVFSQYGWVQSYGSRCVKPPIIFGDIVRPHAMTVRWSQYAQSLTSRVMKGMLTGPVTMLNWSFVRDDQPRETTCYQLALAISQEVLDLEKAGIRMIQIDEPALREGLPLRQQAWAAYLAWATRAFKISAHKVADETQIHTHMCYCEFNDIMPAIASLDADVITIETSRSDMELLEGFADFAYPNAIGPGVYDIHSPNVPRKAHMRHLLDKALRHIPIARLWVNPDCGLKTRQWHEVMPALEAMMEVTQELRTAYAGTHAQEWQTPNLADA